MHIFDGNYIKQIKKEASQNQITTLITETNIKKMIKLLQLPALDVEKIAVIRRKLVTITTNGRKVAAESANWAVGSIVMGLIIIGVSVPFWRLGSGLDTFAIIFDLIAFASLTVGVAALQDRRKFKNLLMQSPKFLETTIQQYNHFFKTNFTGSNGILKYSQEIHDNLIKIENIFSQGMQPRNNSYITNLRFSMFGNSLLNLQKEQAKEVVIELGNKRPNSDPKVNEESLLVIN